MNDPAGLDPADLETVRQQLRDSVVGLLEVPPVMAVRVALPRSL